MPRNPEYTRSLILAAADELFYGEGLRAVSVDVIAAKAGITKKTLYYHFRSKDDLITAYLQARDRPTLTRLQNWAGTSGTVADRMERMFEGLGRAAKNKSWKGCGFVRAAGELANFPGHPAVQVARAHKSGVEKWLANALVEEGKQNGDQLARELMLLVDGVVSQTLLHRSPAYAEAAGRAARAILRD
jgi:AcrR family transcriptional regulator